MSSLLFRRRLSSLAALVLVGWVGSALASTPHTFRIDTTGWASPPETIHVAGTFNGWSKTAAPMQPVNQDATSGQWTATLELEPGIHQYKFIVNGEDFVRDPLYSDAELEEPDGHGAYNSAVLIGDDARKLPAPEPNAVRGEALAHRPNEFADRNVVAKDMLHLGTTTQADDVEAVRVIVLGDEPGVQTTHDLALERTELGRDHWAGLLQTEPGETVSYYLQFVDGDASMLKGRNGQAESAPNLAILLPFEVDMTPSFETPDWAKRVVWYQVFVERFRNGDPSNDPGDAAYETLLPWTADWWATAINHGEEAGEDNFYTGHGNVWRRRFGGDLQGLQASLPYLRKLGIDAIYLNPIFEAESMHKYDTADFRHIDDNFGVKSATPTNQIPTETDDPATWQWSESDLVFLDFLEEAKTQGFRVVIDGVFNHVGRAHPYFQDVLTRGQDSPYAQWFEITDWGNPENWRPMDEPLLVHGQPGGIQWDAWDQPNGHLPVFKNDADTGLAPGPKQHIFNITRRWMDPNGDGDPSDGIDGWRLDVPGDIAHPFWIEWRKLVKGINPDAYITGEIWSWAHPWLKGDQFDAVMNYQFAMPALDFFADDAHAISPSEFGKRISRVVFNYPMQVSLAQMNLYDSHDTDRLASMFVNPDRAYDGQNRLQDTGPGYLKREPREVERQRMMQAVAFKMTFVGAPMIYYGTEAGMWSPDDPSNRMPMVWPDLEPYDGEGVRFQPEVFNRYQHLIAMRRSLTALQLGGFEVVEADDERGLFVFARQHANQRVVVVVNRSDQAQKVNVAVGMEAVADASDQSQTKWLMADRSDRRATLAWREQVRPLEPDQHGQVEAVARPFGVLVLAPMSALPIEP
ncbi:MAG: alpha-amylase family glycosyl hydrolase [Planctomycetota bacterium]